MYEKPQIVSYTRDEIADLLGPVETQYCDAQIQPSTVQLGQSATLIVDFSDLPNFDTVLYEVSDGSGGDTGSIPRSAGEVKGTEWSVTEFVPREASPGTYNVEIRLAAGGEIGEPCNTTITIIGEVVNGVPDDEP